MIKKRLSYAIYFILFACFVALLFSCISTDRLSLYPNSAITSLFVPKTWQPKAIQDIGIVSGYIWTAQDGTKPEMLHVKLSQTNPTAFSKHMIEQGFRLDVEQSKLPTLSTWVKGNSVVKTNIGLPCEHPNYCERFIILLE